MSEDVRKEEREEGAEEALLTVPREEEYSSEMGDEGERVDGNAPVIPKGSTWGFGSKMGRGKSARQIMCIQCGILFFAPRYRVTRRFCTKACGMKWHHKQSNREYANRLVDMEQVNQDHLGKNAPMRDLAIIEPEGKSCVTKDGVVMVRGGVSGRFVASKKSAEDDEIRRKVEEVYKVLDREDAPIAPELPSGPLVKVEKPVGEMSREEKVKLLRELEEAETSLKAKVEAAKAQDPFWFYEPSTGNISEERWAFFRETLKADDVPPSLTGQVDAHRSTASVRGVSGGNQCLGGETRIYDPVLKVARRVDEIDDNFHVYAWDGKKLVVALAEKPFKKPNDDLYRFEFSNGKSVVASMSHLVLTRDGYRAFGELPEGSSLFRPPTISESVPSVHDGDVRSLSRIILDFLADCRACCRFCGERLQEALNTVQGFFPSPIYAHERMERAFLRTDVPEYKQDDIRSCRSLYRPSNRDEEAPSAGLDADFSLRPWRKFSKSFCRSSQVFQRPHDVSSRPSQSTDGYLESATGFSRCFVSRMTDNMRRLIRLLRGVVFQSIRRIADHVRPIFLLDLDCYQSRDSLEVTKVTHIRRDVKYDFTVPIYHNYFCAGLVHHNSGKTTVTTVEALMKATGAVPKALEGIVPEERITKQFPVHVRVVGKDWTNGILLNVLPTYQKWAPREFLVDGKWEKSWSAERSTLFLGKKGVLHGTIEFMSNAQDVTSFQGPPRDMMVYDEEPRQDIYKENLMRFTTRGKVDVMFGMTPTEGLTWIWDKIVNRGEDDQGNRVEWFKLASIVNPKANLSVLREIVKDLTYEEKKMRLLGEFISLSGLVYGRLFDRKVHLIEPFETRCQCGGGETHADGCPWTLYYVVRGLDPHLVTPTATVWVALDRMGNAYVDRCWFEESDMEEVKRGIEARSHGMRLGWSVTDSAADSNIAAFGGLNVFKKLTTGTNRIRVLRPAAKGQGSIKTGVDELKQWLRPSATTGRPRLYIMNRPENRLLINAFETMERDAYSNEDKRGLKDKILESKHHLHAALRYVFMQTLRWVPPYDDSAHVLDAAYAPEEIFS